MEKKIKLVVINENMLGYVDPRQPSVAGILASSVIHGASHSAKDGVYPLAGSSVRLASEVDFESFRVEFEGYKNDPKRYEWA